MTFLPIFKTVLAPMPQQTNCPVLIVEDELLIADHISRILRSAGFSNILIAINVDEAITAIKDQKPQVVLTDIMLGSSKTGIDLGGLLQSEYKIPFIYITSHSDPEMLSKAKHTHPNAYLVKPFKKEDLLVAIELALFSAETLTKPKDGQRLLIKDGHAMAQIPYDDILYLEAEGNYTLLHTNTGKKRLIRSVITDIHEKLPSEDFIRVHRSFVVNKKHVTGYKSSMVYIKAIKLPVGRTYKEFLDEQFR
jgi:two-component system response regulator LytT